jgi:hypothetical protein
MGRPRKDTTIEEENVSVNTDINEKQPVDSKQPEPTIELKKSDYERLMAQLERNAKDIDLLYKASDKHRMAKAMNSNGEVLVKTVNVWTWGDTGKIVLATKLITNKCEVVLGRWIEDQTMNVILEDGEVLTVPYLEFSRNILKKIPSEILSTTTGKDGVIFKVQLPTGKVLEINSSFVN